MMNGSRHNKLKKEEMRERPLPKYIHIHGRRWFDRVNGNTYFTCDIWVDGEHVTKLPYQYGYGSQYAQEATCWLVENGYLPDKGKYTPLWHYRDEYGIKIVDMVDDFPRKKDL